MKNFKWISIKDQLPSIPYCCFATWSETERFPNNLFIIWYVHGNESIPGHWRGYLLGDEGKFCSRKNKEVFDRYNIDCFVIEDYITYWSPITDVLDPRFDPEIHIPRIIEENCKYIGCDNDTDMHCLLNNK